MKRASVKALLAVLTAGAATAIPAQQTVYRCTDASGKTTYRDARCDAEGGNHKERVLALPANPRPVTAAAKPAGPPLYKPEIRAGITLYYDPANEPMEYPTAQVEAIIQFAINAWSVGCQVDLSYGGRAPYQADGTPERVSIRWRPDYMQARHPSHQGAGIAGTGSMRTGIQLTTRMADLKSVFVHELGHVLGLEHSHEDLQSVMSYLRDETARTRSQPSQGDYLACNLAMKKNFGIDFKPEAGSGEPARVPRMTDREALERKYGPRTP